MPNFAQTFSVNYSTSPISSFPEYNFFALSPENLPHSALILALSPHHFSPEVQNITTTLHLATATQNSQQSSSASKASQLTANLKSASQHSQPRNYLSLWGFLTLDKPSNQTRPSYYNALQKTFSTTNPQEIADSINKNIEKRYDLLIPNNEYESINLMKANQLISDQNVEQMDQVISLIDQPKQIAITPEPSFSLSEIISGGTVILLGLAGASYVIVQQYSKNPQWHLELWQKLRGKTKEPIAENVVNLHDQAYQEIEKIVKAAKRVESQRFEKQDFIHLTLLRCQINKNQGEYEGISENVRKFQAAITVKAQQAIIEHLELNHQGYIHQQFYQYFRDLLNETTDPQILSQSLHQALAENLSEVQTEEGKDSLKAYIKALDKLIELPDQPFSLNLYKKLNDLDSKEYQALKAITEMVADLPDEEITNLKTLTCLAIAHQEIFETLGKLISLAPKDNNPKTYAKILQYQVMCDRYQASLDKFDQLLAVLKQWYQQYQVMMGIREEYPQSDYQQPPSFEEKIPGLSLYLKHKNRLCNQTTGVSYLDFEEELQATKA